MPVFIYAGMRNGARDQDIHDTLIYKRVIEVARELKLSPGAIRAAEKHISNTSVFELNLLGGGQQSARSWPTPSERPRSARTGTTRALFETLNCPAR